MKRNPLVVPEEYIASLQEVLGSRLGNEYIHTREGKNYLAAIAQRVGEINAGLTIDRKEFLAKRYLKNPALRQAYLVYYTTTNFLKDIIPLRELYLHKELPQKITALDLGAGTGAASLGLMHYLNEKGFGGEARLHLADAVTQNLEDASRLIHAFARKMQYEVNVNVHPMNIGGTNLSFDTTFDLVIVMNTVNELDEMNDKALLEHLSKILAPDGSLVVIEPAARPPSRRTLRFRDKAVQSGWTVYAPCTRQSYCPALTSEGDWCHSEDAWERPAFIKAIDDFAGTLRLSLKYTYFILNRNGDTLPTRLQMNGLSRVVSDRFDEKGRIRLFLCNEAGRYEHIMNKRDRSSANEMFAVAERYDVVKAAYIEPREHNRKVIEASEIQIVLPILGARN